MSVSLTGSCLPPSSSLPSIRSLLSASEDQVFAALKNLQALYCPVRLPTTISHPTSKREHTCIASPPGPADSGYASQDEGEDDENEVTSEEVTAALRADPFERTFATQWLNSLLARSEEMEVDDDIREKLVDDAGFILSSLFDNTDKEEEALTRDFRFSTSFGEPIEVTLNDAPLSSTDHTAVGLQSWGASIVLSSMVCAEPERFGLPGNSRAGKRTIIELGAGTGLVSLAVAKLLPVVGIESVSITATDYHPAVLENCDANIKTNFPPSSYDTPPVDTAILDWAEPPTAMKSASDLLIASDVVYAPEHAAWLRDCAAHLLAQNGLFWLMVTVRKTGKFEGIPDTVEAAFEPELCPKSDSGLTFKILEKEFVEKRRGIGRGDESGYNLYRIGWA
ncbi:putative methyltransferase-domain-containing protein [Alternaria rosae]|uniref:putative methyltransferase-domain-containing protein n=1 Tax=Alternaria rosae TaxID=1187941 RepID=UPI001E8EC9D5|nr:putative methyltransferase-domain-containing protein [Alternaria rosae]KAH6878679.1 putative methyltransferase-domain-containing protein [Alternaria rosae]